VVVENLDEVFRGLAEEGQQRWRSYLQENPFTTILATSQSLFAGISLRTAPFYGFFAIEHLEEFSLDDAIDLLTRIARYREDGALAALLQTPTGRDRVQAVQHLAGNNPRVYVILSQFINYTSLDELVEPVLRTLDDLTPFYQSRMLLLSPQQRKIVDLLCDDRHPVPVGEIAQRCFISHQTASGQLKTLREMGYVHPIGIGRESYYEIHEPLLRLCAEVKKQRGEPIRLFIEFLRLWYSRGEIEQRLTALALDATIERGYLLRALDVEDTRWLRGEEESGTPVREPGEVAETDDLDDVATWRDRGRNLERQGRYEEALAAYEQAIVLAPQDAANWRGKGRVALGRLGRYEEALAAYAKAVTLAPQDAANWYNKGVTLGFLGRYEEAVTAYDAALAAGAVFPKAFYCRALALFRLERWDEAVDALDGALGRYAEGDRDAGDLEVIFQHLLERSGAHIPWPSSIAEIVDVFDRHNALAVLGNALVRAIARLRAPDLDNEARDTWLRLWQEATRGHAEMQVPLRLLGAAVRFLNTNDRRALLELAIEERAIVQPLLGVEELPSRR
jgi:tetratricopeptide (TPR) repeat protein